MTSPTPEEERNDRITRNLEAGLTASGMNEYELRMPASDFLPEPDDRCGDPEDWMTPDQIAEMNRMSDIEAGGEVVSALTDGEVWSDEDVADWLTTYSLWCD